MASNRPAPLGRRPRVFVTRRLPTEIEVRLGELFDVTLNPDDAPPEPEALARACAVYDVVVPTVTDSITADLIGGGGRPLGLLANYGTGYEHIDLDAARTAGVIVTNTPGVLTEDTADLTMALIVSVPRRLVQGARCLRDGEWLGWSPTGLLGSRVNGKRLGIIGMGRIGRAVAERARAFGLSVHYHNRRRLPDSVERELGATWHPDLDALLPTVDLLTLHCPLTAQTRHLLDERRLALLQPHAVIVNTARGDLIDEDALGRALAEGRIAGAGLDVYSTEPAVPRALLAAPNTVLLPHLGSATHDGRRAMGEVVIANIRAWADGHRPPNQVLDALWR